MLRYKPTRQKGQELRKVPTYTIPEAALFLAIKPGTLFQWYAGRDPLLKPSGRFGNNYLLSFADLEEAYKVYLLRQRYHFSFQYLRRAMSNARKVSHSQHPLRNRDSIKECLGHLVYESRRRGKRPRIVQSLADKPGQQLLDEVVDLFGRRISPEQGIFPWRFAESDEATRPVSLNPQVMSGRLVLTGTRIPVKAIVGRTNAGANVEEIADDYHVDSETIKKALVHIGIRQKAA